MKTLVRLDTQRTRPVFDGELLRHLFRYVRPYAGVFALSIVLSLLVTMADLALPFLMKTAIDRYIVPVAAAGQSAAALDEFRVLIGLFLLVIALSFGCSYWNGVLLTRGGQGVVRDMRNDVYRHIVGLCLSFFHRHAVGRLVSRVTNDVESISEFFTMVLSTAVKNVLLIAGIMALMVHLNPTLGGMVLALMPMLMVLTLVFRHYVGKAYRLIRLRVAELNAALAETLNGIRIVKLFRREASCDADFRRLSRSVYDAHMDSTRAYALFQPTVKWTSLLAVGLALWFGGLDVRQGDMSIGTLVAFVSYVQMLFVPIADLAEKYNIFQGAMAGAERVQETLQVDERLPEPVAPAHPTSVRGGVAIEHVSFGYGDGPDVLHDVSLTIEPGQAVAVVGHTGSGKSTLLSLLLRLYDVRRGRILLDGVDLREWNPAHLRRVLSMVPQDVVLFSDSIRDNVCLWDRSIGEEQLRAGLAASQAGAVVERLPGGLDHVMAERGQTLSVGERQLVAFARTLVQDPKVLILDEATSSIDPATERMIQQALERLLENRTAVIVAHRLTTIRRADRIVVLHQGRIVEDGTHRELLAHRGYYYALYRTQFVGALSA